jgi:hypothetical protein
MVMTALVQTQHDCRSTLAGLRVEEGDGSYA